MRNKASLLLFCCCSCLSMLAIGQVKKSKWTNKDKGTVITNYSAIHVYPKDTTATGISNSVLVGIAFRFYELTPEGCRQIEGKIKINGKEFTVSDSTNMAGTQREIYAGWIAEGDYSFSTSAGNEHYPIQTKKYFLSRGLSYRFDFYLVRKNALQRN